jgi:hypothetical protein
MRGVIELQLGDHLGDGPIRDPVQAHQWGIADQFSDIFGNVHEKLLWNWV